MDVKPYWAKPVYADGHRASRIPASLDGRIDFEPGVVRVDLWTDEVGGELVCYVTADAHVSVGSRAR